MTRRVRGATARRGVRALVDGALAPRRRRDARYDELLELVRPLRETPPVEARPEFVADLRARLMTAADTAPRAGRRDRGPAPEPPG